MTQESEAKDRARKLAAIAEFLDSEYLPDVYGMPMDFILLASPRDANSRKADFITNAKHKNCIDWMNYTIELMGGDKINIDGAQIWLVGDD